MGETFFCGCLANSSSGSLSEPPPSLFQKEGVTAVIIIRNYKLGCINLYPLCHRFPVLVRLCVMHATKMSPVPGWKPKIRKLVICDWWIVIGANSHSGGMALLVEKPNNNTQSPLQSEWGYNCYIAFIIYIVLSTRANPLGSHNVWGYCLSRRKKHVGLHPVFSSGEIIYNRYSLRNWGLYP